MEQPHRETREPSLANRLLAEVVGTAALTFVASVTTGSDTVKVVAPALVLGALIFTLGSISGCHLNPAVTLAFTLRGAFPVRLVVGYWLAQLVGCVAAGGLARALVGPEATRAGIPQAKVAEGHAFGWEVLLTFLLVLVILGTGRKARLLGPEAAIPVAAVLALDGLLGGPFSGASMNPARALGPAIAVGKDPGVVYTAAPFLGAAAAVLLAFLVFGPPQAEEQTAAEGDGD